MGALKAVVIGVGYLGRFHLEKFTRCEGVEVIGIVDTDLRRAHEVSTQFRVPAYRDLDAVLTRADLASVVVPPDVHHEVARRCLEHGVHVLVEKPMTQTLAEAQDLIDLAARQGLVLQVGHLERFNPGLRRLGRELTDPMFIECHRLAPFQPRGSEVDVILDLMIHDIDLVLSCVPSEIREVRAVGVPVLTTDIDIVNARLEFANGCVANLTASRVTPKAMRKLRIFQADAYFSLDTLGHKLTIARKGSAGAPTPIAIQELSFDKTDALMLEIQAFVDAVRGNGSVLVTGEEGKKALAIALDIRCGTDGTLTHKSPLQVPRE
ncbi:MAG: Gfo/Idh/MocA family protein [Gammaproteobacteria bacterium]